MTEPQRRLRIAGLHHLTLLCSDLEASTAFYRNVLGMRMVKQTVNADDEGARHLFFGDEEGRPGTLTERQRGALAAALHGKRQAVAPSHGLRALTTA